MYFKSILLSFFMFFFVACAGKDMKKFGGEFALANRSGEPISTALTVALGGVIYGMGAIAETQEEAERAQKIVPLSYQEELYDENTTAFNDIINVQSSNIKYERAQESNNTIN